MILAALSACGPPPPLVAEDLPAPARRFVVGNESRHDLFAPALADRRGALLCVGGDHCLTLLATLAADLTVLLDHDPRVVALHHELGRRLAASPDPDALLADLATPPALDLAAAWPHVVAHLRRVAARPRTWLSDPVLYARSRDRWQTGAVHPLLGDLTGAAAMASIAAHTRARGLAFTAVYLSNAEETVPDRAALAHNLAALPRTADAVLLRTFYLPDWPAADGLWSYQIHRLDHHLAHPAPDLATIITAARARGELHVDPDEPALSTIAPP